MSNRLKIGTHLRNVVLMVTLIHLACNSLPDVAVTVESPPNTNLTPGDNVLSGTVTDPATGQPMSGVTVTVTVENGGSYFQAETTTNSNGTYSFTNVPTGNADIQVVVDGNITTNEVTVTGTGGTYTNVNLSPPSATYSNDKFVIVLTWGNDPRDLDSHLWVPTGGSATRVFYGYLGDSDGVLDAIPFAGLDVDDVNGNGPETVTIKMQNNVAYYGGTYRYFIHKYSGSLQLATSSAVVTVYKDGTQIKQYNVPTSGTTERYWHVFDLSGATITDVNVLQATAPAAP